MKQLAFTRIVLGIVILTAGLTTVSLVPAQEPAELQLEFIQSLRKKGLADLALEHIEKLQKQNPPPKLAALLPLEAARTRVALAQTKQPEDRMKLLTQAQKDLSAYLAAKKQSEEGPQLQLEIARLTTYQGQARLGQAFRAEDPKDKDDKAKKARADFIDARKKYDAALKDMADLLAKYKNADAKKEKEFKSQLASDLVAGKFDRAKTFIFEARTFLEPDGDDRKKQAELYETASEALKTDVINDKSKANEEARWLAGAWYIDVARRAGKGQLALDFHTALMKIPPAGTPEVITAQRWARYFYIQAIRDGEFHPPTGVSKSLHLIDQCTKWLAQYKKYQNQPEGLGVQFELAYAYLDQAKITSPKYSDPKAKPLYDLAQKYFAQVAASHSDFSETANRQSIKLKLNSIGEATTIASLKDFEECFLKARYEMFQMQQTGVAIKEFLKDPPPDKEKRDKEMKVLQKKQKGHMKSIVAAFQRALELTTPTTPPFKVDEVRYFLAYTYLLSGDPYRAAVMSEYLAHKEPPGKHAPLAANYALQAYEQILKKQNEPANQEKLFALADFVLKDRAGQWKDEPVTAVARYSLALFYMRQKDYVKSIGYLEKLPKEFRSYIFSQCQLAIIALNVSADAAKESDQKKFVEYRTKALTALRNIPTLPKTTDPATAAMYFTAQLNQGTILYNDYVALIKDNNDKKAEVKLKDMVKFTKSLLKQFGEFRDRMDDSVSDKLEGGLQNLDKFARFGETRLAYKAGDYDKVLSKDYTGDVVTRLTKLAGEKGELALPDYQVTGDLLGLALRANVQKGKFKEAEKVLALVQKLKNPNALDDKTSATASIILQSLLADLSNQIKTLKKEGKEDKLKETIKNFSTFFDALIKDKDSTTLKYNDRAFLANCYASVDQHAKAAELYSALPRPELKLPDKASKEEKAAVEAAHKKADQMWCFLQVRCGEEWRLAKEPKKAKEVLEKLLEDPKAAAKIQAQKELILVFEDEKNFRKAIESWNAYLKSPGLLGQMNNPAVPAATKKKAKELYYDAYYHYIFSWYMFSQNDGKKKEDQYIAQAANYVWRLELEHQKAATKAAAVGQPPPTDTGWAMIGDRLNTLMDTAPKLKQEYQNQKQKASSK